MDGVKCKLGEIWKEKKSHDDIERLKFMLMMIRFVKTKRMEWNAVGNDFNRLGKMSFDFLVGNIIIINVSHIIMPHHDHHNHGFPSFTCTLFHSCGVIAFCLLFFYSCCYYQSNSLIINLNLLSLLIYSYRPLILLFY